MSKPAENIPAESTPASGRRTQNERSEAMRARLVEATLDCLETEGYAGTTISKIVERAQVSRGAPVHHFPSKDALIQAAAEQLIRQLYVQMGHAIKSVDESADRLHDIIMVSWKKVFGTRESTVLLELMIASTHDEELAQAMHRLWAAGSSVLSGAAEHYFEPLTADDSVHKLMILTQWLLRGMSMDRHLVDGEYVFDHFLTLWSRMLALHMRAKPGITQPPPRPELWDSTVVDMPAGKNGPT